MEYTKVDYDSSQWEGQFLKPIDVNVSMLSPQPLSHHDPGKQFLLPMDVMSPPITPHDYYSQMFIQTDPQTLSHHSPNLMQSSPTLLNSSPMVLNHSPPLSLDSPPLMIPYEMDFQMNSNMIPQEYYETQWMQPNIPPQVFLDKSPLQRLKQLKTAASESSLHTWSSQSQPQEQFPCTFPGCTKVFSKQTNLKSHARIHLTDRSFVCQDCGACFRRSHDLKRHQRSLHSDVKPFGCARCGKRFSRMDALKRHTARVTSACYIAGLME